MSQATSWGVSEAGPQTPTAHAVENNDSLDALLSQHLGASRPTYAVQGTIWNKDLTASSPPLIETYMFDGTDDILISTFNISANTIEFSGLVPGTDIADQHITVNGQTGTTYTTVLADDGKLVTLSNAAAIALTIPTNASVAYPIGTTIAFQQLGAGLVTMSGGGVTFNNRNGLVSGGQYAVWSITKTATNTWTVAGDLTT